MDRVINCMAQILNRKNKIAEVIIECHSVKSFCIFEVLWFVVCMTFQKIYKINTYHLF